MNGAGVDGAAVNGTAVNGAAVNGAAVNGVEPVTVIGGGPIGLAIAWRCAAAGLAVTLHDPQPGSGAGAVAAGMLSPVAEAYFGEEELTGLLVASAARWPAFAAELTAASGIDLGHRGEGTLVVGLTRDDAAAARRLWTYQRQLGLALTPLDSAALRAAEPSLTPRIGAGALLPDDHQVDPRRLVTALREAVVRAGVRLVPSAVTDLDTIGAGTTVVAAGWASGALTGLPVRPVKGEILRLRAPAGAAPALRHVIRGQADGEPVYLVPRSDGEVVVGATVEEHADTRVSAGAVLRLLRAATALVPELAEYDLVETAAGLRPGTPDNRPLIGELPGRPGVLVATGHYRHGIVLTPLTAELIRDRITVGAALPDSVTPGRFAASQTRKAQSWT